MSKITPGSNQMWEGSRFILPEHVEMLIQQDKEEMKKTKPEFDEQYLQELAMKIAEAKQEEYTVAVNVFDEYEDIRLVGRIKYIDMQLRRLKVVYEDDWDWVRIDDILDIEKV